MNRQITVIGAGISGLTLVYWLSKSDHDVLLLEKNKYAGGTMETEISDGFLFDRGPNSGLETTPLIREIVDDIGLTDEMVYASSEAKKRYILRHNTLWALPTGPGTFLNTKLFSKRAKLRLLAEPFIPKNSTDGEGYDTTVASFVRRRLGQEFLDYAVNPFISGVFAGDPEKLSIKSALPRLYNLEEQYGGLIKGMIKGRRERKKSGETSKQHARMFSFLHGMQSFPQAISRSLKDKPVYEAEVVAVRPSKKILDGYTVIYNKDNKQYSIESKMVVSTVPAYNAASIFSSVDNGVSKHLDSIFYPAVLVLYLGYKKKDVRKNLDGFGFLNPQKEEKLFLGAIWNSTIFQKRTDEGSVSFTLFVGGARSQIPLGKNMKNEQDELIRNVTKEFQEIMDIQSPPVYSAKRVWEKAIPQYNVGYIEHDRYFSGFEKKYHGLFLAGNYRGGISIGDCVKSSHALYQKITGYLSE